MPLTPEADSYAHTVPSQISLILVFQVKNQGFKNPRLFSIFAQLEKLFFRNYGTSSTIQTQT